MSERWIDVKQELPPDRAVVLLWNGTEMTMGYGAYTSDRPGAEQHWIWMSRLLVGRYPSHWMPLPDPPTGASR